MRYIALTIGPIYKTLKNARKPKELWSSSYFFSYIMKKIIEKFKDREFVMPYISDKSIFNDSDVGLFHDRFIFKSQDGDLEKLKDAMEHPEKEEYKNLVVKVTGYSAHFVVMDKKFQEEFVQRVNYNSL